MNPTPYELWAELGRDGKIAGFAVTTRDRMPVPVCYVAKANRSGLRSAQAIAAAKASPETEIDLRGRPDSLKRFIGKSFMLVDRQSPPASNRTRIVGLFLRNRAGVHFAVFNVKIGEATFAPEPGGR